MVRVRILHGSLSFHFFHFQANLMEIDLVIREIR